MRTGFSSKYTAIVLVFLFALLSAVSSGATTSTSKTELIMVEEAGCVYCAKFNREISVAYPKTAEGKTAPLRRLDLHKEWPAALDHIERPRFTPTFILIHNNNEVGRLIGYNGDEYFWFLLGELLNRIDTDTEKKTAPDTKQSG